MAEQLVAEIIVLDDHRPARSPRYSPGIAAEAWMEISEAARRLLTFAEHELTASWSTGNLGRLRQLQTVHADATAVLAQGRRHAGWADTSSSCADGVREPGHGAAA